MAHLLIEFGLGQLLLGYGTQLTTALDLRDFHPSRQAHPRPQRHLRRRFETLRDDFDEDSV